jgi:predicted metalloprotease with PDZ domain
MRPAILIGIVLLLGTVSVTAADFGIDYRVRFLPTDDAAEVVMQVTPGENARASHFDLLMPKSRYTLLEADGETERKGSRLHWSVPHDGGSLSYRYRVSRKRGTGYDARIGDSFALLRGDQLFPAGVMRATLGAHSRTTVRFDLPEGWSVETPYPLQEGGYYLVEWSDRRFARPVGWLIAGDLGVRRDIFEGTQFVVAAPRGESMRRQDILAMFHWTHYELRMAFGELPDKILIVGAGDPFWRGGLSGPRSVYLHAGRPLILEDGTSTLLHELVHSLTRIRGTENHNWIAEGIAEFYAVELMHRAGVTTDERHQRTRRYLRQRDRSVDSLVGRNCSGPCIAAAAVLFQDLDAEIRKATEDEKSLDDVVRVLMKESRRVSPERLREVAEEIADGSLRTLRTSKVRVAVHRGE